MIIKIREASNGTGSVVNLRCPACHQRGTFLPIGGDAAVTSTDSQRFWTGQRRCPDPKCSALIFFASGSEGLVASFPSERIDFDSSNIPVGVLSALEEAITCHAAACYVAAAIMVRKTLEELCRDRGATGSTLKDRIRSLGTRIVIPQELLDGLDDLRLLGNDAAHIESNSYDKVGKEEVEIGIEVTKEVLKAVYQYASLIGRLRALKKS